MMPIINSSRVLSSFPMPGSVLSPPWTLSQLHRVLRGRDHYFSLLTHPRPACSQLLEQPSLPGRFLCFSRCFCLSESTLLSPLGGVRCQGYLLGLPVLCTTPRGILSDFLTSRPCQCPLRSPLVAPHVAPRSTNSWQVAPASGINRLSHETASSVRTELSMFSLIENLSLQHKSWHVVQV